MDSQKVNTENKPELQPGEKMFTAVLFVIGLFFFIQAFSLWSRMDEPRIASAAALPLFTSGAWTIFTGIIILENLRKKSPLSGLKSFSAVIKQGLSYAFPKQIVVMLCAVAVYCTALLFRISFYIATPIFLYGTMCFLMGKDYIKKNLIWTGALMAFIFLVFQKLMGVVLP